MRDEEVFSGPSSWNKKELPQPIQLKSNYAYKYFQPLKKNIRFKYDENGNIIIRANLNSGGPEKEYNISQLRRPRDGNSNEHVYVDNLYKADDRNFDHSVPNWSIGPEWQLLLPTDKDTFIENLTTTDPAQLKQAADQASREHQAKHKSQQEGSIKREHARRRGNAHPSHPGLGVTSAATQGATLRPMRLMHDSPV